MKKGKCAILALQGKNKKIFGPGEIITDNSIENFDTLVDEGKIKLLVEAKKEPAKPVSKPADKPKQTK